MDAFDVYVTKNFVGPVWRESSEIWVTPVCEDVAAVAKSIGDLQDQWHDLILGQPIQYLAGQTPVADIAAELALPGDEVFTGIKRVVQISGILFGLASGQPLVVNACLKSLVHDAILKVISEKIGDFLRNTLDQSGEPETALTRDALTQQATELELFEIRRDKQGKYERSKHGEAPWSDHDNQQVKKIELLNMDTNNMTGKGRHTQKSRTTQPEHRQALKTQAPTDPIGPPSLSPPGDIPLEELPKPDRDIGPPQGHNEGTPGI